MKGLMPAIRNALPYATILIVASYLYHHALNIQFDAGGHPGPAFWPKMALGLLIGACVVGIAGSIHRSWWVSRKPWIGAEPVLPEHAYADPTAPSTPNRLYPWIAIALTAGYVGLLPQVGFFVGTAFYVAASIYFGNYRRSWIAIVIGLSASAIFMIVFMKIVYVSLPLGEGAFEHVSTFMMSASGIR